MQDGRRGATPVVGAVLLVALVVVLSAGVWLTVTAIDMKEPAPRAHFDYSSDVRTITLQHDGRDPVNICRLDLLLDDGMSIGSPERYSLDEFPVMYLNGEQVTSCQKMYNGDRLRVHVYWHPKKLTVTYTTDSVWPGDEETYIIDEQSFRLDIHGYCTVTNTYGVSKQMYGQSCFPAADSTPHVDWSHSIDGQGVYQTPRYYLVANSSDGVYRINAYTGAIMEYTSISGLSANTMPTTHGAHMTIFDQSTTTLYVLQTWDIVDGVNYTDTTAVTQAQDAGSYSIIYGRSGGTVVRFNTTTNAETWTTSLGSSIDMTYPPILDWQDMVFITTDTKLHALDEQDGSPIWETEIGPHPGVSVALAGDDMIGVVAEGELKAVDVDTGSVEWTTSTTADEIRSPVTYEDTFIVPRANGSIAAYDIHDGTLQWQRTDPGGSLTTPVVARHRVYLWSENGSSSTLYAYEATDGDFVWKKTGLNSTGNPPPQPTLGPTGEYLYIEGTAYRDPTPPQIAITDE